MIKPGVQTIDSDRRYIGRLKATCKLTYENFLINIIKTTQVEKIKDFISQLLVQAIMKSKMVKNLECPALSDELC